MPPELERKLNSFAKSEGKSRSEVVKDSILEYIKNHGKTKTPFELGEDLFGKHTSDVSDLAQNRKKYLHQSVKGKNAKRSSN
ncbi:ribbon-helix-helix protein, CopG family [Leptospira interrogans serovar Valbuzzi str. Duyster]|nr:ribbon-helix-helix protein, CopG family [Leptospira interrogans serovar Valbuzzi str. Duyster]ENO74245.1 ribbon-helix-helix protein, CopG family [Leptospira interrogans serovar Valbuzzi str. Valbuzzi]KAA1265050.1 ribbon-helix-helix protein, CopG family [Leptospira interrogans serovar Weerasinghe]